MEMNDCLLYVRYFLTTLKLTSNNFINPTLPQSQTLATQQVSKEVLIVVALPPFPLTAQYT